MKVKLKSVTEIFYGPHQRAELDGDTKYLVASHFDDLHQPCKFKDSYIDNPKEQAILKEGDVIFTGKGQRFFAWAYTPDFGRVVPSSLFYILRIQNSELLLAEYLAYYLNSERINAKLRSLSAGTSLPSIQKNELGFFNIEVPSIQEQVKVIELAKLLDQDVQLSSQLLLQKKNLRKGLIDKIINK